MKLRGYGYPDYDSHEFRYQYRGEHFCTVRDLSLNWYVTVTFIYGQGENWSSYHDRTGMDDQPLQKVINDDKNHTIIAQFSQCGQSKFTFDIEGQSICAEIIDGRIEFCRDGVLIGYDSEIRNAKGEKIHHPAASELRVAEFNDDLDRRIVMLLLGTNYLRSG